MANDVNIPVTGSGDTGPVEVATEEITSVHYQKIKLIDSTVGSEDPIGVTANPLKTSIVGTPAVTVSGVATSAKQDTGNTSLASVDTKLSSQATAAKQDTGNTSLSSIDTKLSSQATATKQDTGNTSLASLETKIGEVQASPTANTVLDRLKALLTGIVLAAGTAIIGKVGIDQTTPGTTNAVKATNFPTTADTNAGAASASTLRTVTASDSPDVSVLGATADAAIITDTTGSIKGVLRGILKVLISFTQSVYQKTGTAITFQDASGTVVLATNGLATVNGVTSAEYDRGAGALPGWFRWEATVRWQATPVVGDALRIYARAYDTSGNIYPAASTGAITPETKLNDWDLIDTIYCGLASSSQSFYKSGKIFLPGRYVMVAVWNNSAAANTATNNITTVTLTPLFNQQQSWS